MGTGAGQRGDRRDGNMITKDQWRSTSSTAAAIKNNVVGAGLQRKIDVVLDMVCGQLEPDGDATRPFAHLIRNFAKISRRMQVRERRRRDRALTRF